MREMARPTATQQQRNSNLLAMPYWREKTIYDSYSLQIRLKFRCAESVQNGQSSGELSQKKTSNETRLEWTF